MLFHIEYKHLIYFVMYIMCDITCVNPEWCSKLRSLIPSLKERSKDEIQIFIMFICQKLGNCFIKFLEANMLVNT